MNMQAIMETILGRLHSSAQAKMVYGEPITVGDRTVIPVAKISYGFGSGFGPEGPTTQAAGGGGGGGGVTAKPVGALEITAAGTRFIDFNESGKYVGAALFGVLLGISLKGRRK